MASSRKLSADDKRLVVGALLHRRAQALEVAAMWSPTNGNIPKTIRDPESVAEIYKHMTDVAATLDRLASEVNDPNCDLWIARRQKT